MSDADVLALYRVARLLGVEPGSLMERARTQVRGQMEIAEVEREPEA